MLRIAGAVVLLAAILLGVINKAAPHLFLALPMGFIPWAIGGNPMPPFFDPTPMRAENLGKWVKDGDVIVAAAAKAGTNWMLYCSHQIRSKGKGKWTEVLLDTPWMEVTHNPGENWEDRLERHYSHILPDGTNVSSYWNSPEFPFRIFKSHMTPLESSEHMFAVLPIRQFPKVKFVAVVRNGLDVVRSLYSFVNSHRSDFKSIWGSFPPPYSPDTAGKQQCLKDMIPGGNLGHLYFDYVKSWWEYRNDPNVLLLHFQDLKSDLKGSVTKLSNFIGVPLTEHELSIVTDRCHINHMSEIRDSFDMRLWSYKSDPSMTIVAGGSTIRSGQVGEGEDFFTEDMRQEWAEVTKRHLEDPDIRRWAASGGPFSLA